MNTLQGAKALKTKVNGIRGQVKEASQAINTLGNLGEKAEGKLDFRIEDTDPPKDENIVEMHGAFVAMKQAALDAVNAIEVPDLAEFQAIAQTPNP